MDAIGKFNYSGKFWDRYRSFFDACAALPANARVLIVGANDGDVADPARHIWQPGWEGWFIEPNPDVPLNEKNVIRAAVAENVGTLKLYRMSEEAAEAYRAVGAHGSCLTSFSRQHIEKRLRKNLSRTYARLRGSAIETITVPCGPLGSLVSGYFDLIQIDVEGMEPVVVPQALAMRPQILLFEHQHTPGTDLDEMAKAQGYATTRLRNDTLAVLSP